jgi:hypothetical protein
MMKKILIFVFSILISVPCVFAGEVGTITYVEGRVDLSQQGAGIAAPVRDGDKISVGDAIRTKSDSKAEVTFLDRSKLRLAQNSRAEVADYQLDKDNKRKTATIKLDRGKARTIIARMADKAEFNILTPNAEGKVKGSDIFTFYQAGTSGMLVAEGNLLLKSLANPEKVLTVTPGNSALVNVEGMPTGPRPYLELEKKLSEQETFVPPSAAKKSETFAIKGMVVKISGDVKVAKTGAQVPHKASYNEVIGEGDRIETGDNGMVEVKFDNGCGLSLKPGTQITITKLVIDPKTGEYQNMFESSKGKIKARIENLKGRSTFEIKTPMAVCGARGTIMYLEITPAMAKAFFEGGSGYIKNLISGAETDIGMGYNGSTDSQGNNSNPAPTSDEERDSWTQGWESDNGTSGYSSPGSNDAPGDLGGNSGGNTDNTNNMGDSGNGDNGNNGNPDVYIPPQPPPAPPVTPTTSTLPAVFRGEGFLYGEVDSSWENPIPFSILGNYSNPGGYRLWNIDRLSGAISDNGSETETSLFGWSAGIKQDNALKGLLYAFYVMPDGAIGYVKSTNVSGYFDPEHSIFAVPNTNTMTAAPLLFETNLLPGGLSEAIQGPYEYTGKVGGDISGALSGESYQLKDQDAGDIFKETLSGSYAGLPGNNWKAVTGGSVDDGHGYYIMRISGDAAWSDGVFQGTMTGRDIGYSGNGRGWLGAPWDGAILGVYYEGASQWEAVTLGYAPIADISFGGETTHEAGVDYAIFGGTEPLWTGSPDILFMGDYSAQGAPSRELWKFHTLGGTSGATTSDEGAIYGMAGGVKLNNVLKGLMYAIYIRPDTNSSTGFSAGYLESTDISGYFYPSLGEAGMFEADGTVNAHSMGETSIRPGQLNEESGFLKREAINGKIQGDISGSLINTSDESESINLEDDIKDQDWSVWRIEASGANPPSQKDWTAVAGGRNNNDDGSNSYWIVHLTGTDWSSDGNFAGAIDGTVLSEDRLETITGGCIGYYNSETWGMVGTGCSTTDTENNLNSSGRFVAQGWNLGQGAQFDFAGLIGLTGSIWSGDPHLVSIGEFTPPHSANPNGQFAWYGKKEWYYQDGSLAGKDGFVSRILADNPPNPNDPYAYTTYDNGSFYGLSAGIGGDGKLKGIVASLYMSPSGDAGVLYGDVAGDYYADIEMYRMGGDLAKNFHKNITGILPANLRDNISWDSLSGLDDHGGFGVEGEGEGGDIYANGGEGTMLNITGQNWGAWNLVTGGDYSGQPSSSAAWDVYDLTGMTLAHDSDYVGGSWLGGIAGNPASGGKWYDGEIKGSLDAIWIDLSKNGTLSGRKINGEVVGNYIEVDAVNDTGTWRAASVGEWIEVNPDLLMDRTSEGLDTAMTALGAAANVPITVAYSSVLNMSNPASPTITSMAMNTHLYNMAGGGDGIWAAIINGTYSAPPTTDWSMTVANPTIPADTATLSGPAWSTDGHWTAGVSGTVGGNSITGQAAGTYDAGQFQGAGTGTFTQGT